MKINAIAMSIFIVTLAACGAAPKTPSEFKAQVNGGAMGHQKESYTVNRPFQEVAKTLEQKANECLNVAVESARTYKINHAQTTASHTVTYHPAFKMSENNAELQVRQKVRGDNIVKLQAEPEGGYIALVADTKPLDKSTSQVEVYYAKYKAGTLVIAVKNWAIGKDLRCPDVLEDNP
jgi:hypothetical protein